MHRVCALQHNCAQASILTLSRKIKQKQGIEEIDMPDAHGGMALA
jgi:hypothetical protein